MTYTTAFADFPPESMPAIPSDWVDVSWHNDLCPSFRFWDNGEFFARVWIEYPEGQRETEGGKRFMVTVEGDSILHPETPFESDDWDYLLAYVAGFIEGASK